MNKTRKLLWWIGLIVVFLSVMTYGQFSSKGNEPVNLEALSDVQKQTLDEANAILDNKIRINLDSEEIIFNYEGDFLAFENQLRSAQRLLYAFNFLDTLSAAYELTGNSLYIEHGMELIHDFVEQAPYNIESMTWHDETTSTRMSSFLTFYLSSEDVLSKNDKELIERELKIIAEKIAFSDFYAGSNNHGMYQDMALIRYAEIFEESEIKNIAAERLENYFISHFGSDGAHLENSPEYHFAMVRSLLSALKQYDESILPRYNEIREIYLLSADYSSMILLPNGKTPNIGDTKTLDIDLSSYYDENIIQNVQSAGRRTFMDSGYDIYKSDDTYLLMRAGYHKDYHHHNDDLSFWLYKNGNIFTEFGSFGYEYSNPHAYYQRSFEAHNSLIVDGENIAETKDVHLLDSGSENTMSGITRRIVGGEFQRDIHFDNDLSRLVIENKINSYDENPHHYELLFHLDPSINVELAENQEMNIVNLYRGTDYIGNFITSEKVELKDDYYYPYYYAEPDKTKVISVQANAADINISIEINLQ